MDCWKLECSKFNAIGSEYLYIFFILSLKKWVDVYVCKLRSNEYPDRVAPTINLHNFENNHHLNFMLTKRKHLSSIAVLAPNPKWIISFFFFLPLPSSISKVCEKKLKISVRHLVLISSDLSIDLCVPIGYFCNQTINHN